MKGACWVSTPLAIDTRDMDLETQGPIMPVIVETFATDGPGDVAGLQAMLGRLAIDKVRRLAIIGKKGETGNP